MRDLRPVEREHAHQVLDRLIELLASHPPSSGILRVRLDREGRLHLETREIVAELGGDLTAPER